MNLRVLIEFLLAAVLVAYASAAAINGPVVYKQFNESPTDQEILIEHLEETSNLPEAQLPSDLSNEIDAVTAVAVSAAAEDTVVPTAVEDVSPINENDPDPINKFCTCTKTSCDCCRDFFLPLVPVRGPGCASVKYLGGDRLSVNVKYGNIVLTSRTISGKKATPVCLPLPGGFSQFCGRVYGIRRQGDDFKACLGLELRAEDDVEAALRVSCFKFGPRGVSVSEGEPIPPLKAQEDDDDDDDFLGLGGDDDDDDDDDDDSDDDGDVFGLGDDDEGDDDDDDDDSSAAADADDDDDAPDYTGFSLLNGDFLSDIFTSDSNKKKKQKKIEPSPSDTEHLYESQSLEKANKKPVEPVTTPITVNDITPSQIIAAEENAAAAAAVVPIVTVAPVKIKKVKKKQSPGFLDAIVDALTDDDDDDDDEDEDDEEESNDDDDDEDEEEESILADDDGDEDEEDNEVSNNKVEALSEQTDGPVVDDEDQHENEVAEDVKETDETDAVYDSDEDSDEGDVEEVLQEDTEVDEKIATSTKKPVKPVKKKDFYGIFGRLFNLF